MSSETASIYVGPLNSYNRFIAGDVVTHCQFIRDHSIWTIKPMHPARLDRFKRMLRATKPAHDCDACRIQCNTADPNRIGWANGEPCISTADSR